MIFYTPDIHGLRYTLNEGESAHAVRVLRLKAGDGITLVDGKGGWYRAQICEIHHKHCEVDILEHQTDYGKRPYRLHIGIAPTKNIDRFEWFIEKATEIGIDEITPLLCEHSERKQVNSERIQRIMTAAMKQSKKADLPQLNAITALGNWVETQGDAGCYYIAHCNESNLQSLKTAYRPGQTATIAIGPEGDFSMQEVTQALACGFKEISLGTSRLRTETAGIAACHSIYFMNYLVGCEPARL
jgi:16S rRNA (uracil1498-N3)-methyltransferase